MRPNDPLQRLGMAIVPSPMLLENGARLGTRMEMHRVKQVPMRHRVAAVKRDCLAKARHRFVEQSLAKENVAQIVLGLHESGRQLQRSAVSGARFVQPTKLEQCIAKLVVCMSGVWPKRDATREDSQRFIKPIQRVKELPEVVICEHVSGIERDSALIR